MLLSKFPNYYELSPISVCVSINIEKVFYNHSDADKLEILENKISIKLR
jgi:hypothetical protein